MYHFYQSYFSISTTKNGITYTIDSTNSFAIVGIEGQTQCNAIDPNSFQSTELILDSNVKIGGINYEVLEIAPYAFYRYNHFEKIVFPNNLEKIGNNAFDRGFHIMGELSLVDSLKYLGDYCFAESRIKVLKIGKNVEKIGHCLCGADTVLEKIIVDENNPNFAHDMLYNLYSKNFSILYQVNAVIEHYTTPQTVKLIKTQAFDNIPIKSITITQDCQFERAVFHATQKLQNITFYGSIKCDDHIFGLGTSLKLIHYYSYKPVLTSLFHEMETGSIVVYCCNRFNTDFSGISPIKGFECISTPIKSCVLNYYFRSYEIFIFITILL